MLNERFSGGTVARTGYNAQRNASGGGLGPSGSGSKPPSVQPVVTCSRSLAELLDCPQEVGDRLGRAVQRREYGPGEIIFAQDAACEGLYLLMSGEFWRAAQRREKRLSLGVMQNGTLVELAAALGNVPHTYTLKSNGQAAVLVFPIGALREALELHPPLRMRLLEELGREVSRAYGVVYVPRRTRNRAPRPIGQ
jgi:hypothetical protein